MADMNETLDMNEAWQTWNRYKDNDYVMVCILATLIGKARRQDSSLTKGTN